MKAQTSERKKDQVLTRAVIIAADLLSIERRDLSEILGISEATLSRLNHGQKLISLQNKEGEIAALFLRIYRSLDTIFGGNSELCSKWFHAENIHLGVIPLDRVKKLQGLFDVSEYLDAMRARV